jgi:hypothetical protein
LLLPGLAVVGLGGAPRDEGEGIGYTLFTKAEAEAHLGGQLSRVGRRKVLVVSHTPPLGVLDVAIRHGLRPAGSSVVREMMRRSSVRGVICGHVHCQGGRTEEAGHTLVVNVASRDWLGAPLSYAVLDWDGRRFSARNYVAEDPEALTRVRGVGPVVASRMIEAGFHSLPDVLAGDGAELAAVVGTGVARGMRAHARALRDGVPVLLDRADSFPEDSVVIDVETSVDRQDDPWLIGVMPWGAARVRQFEELDARLHAAHLARVGASLSRLRWKYLVRWGAFDRGALDRAHRRVGLEEPEWLRPGHWLDACAWVKRVVALPIDSGGLKPVADYLGYKFQVSGVDGFSAGCWYARYRDEGIAFDVGKVRAYNRDDVRAVEHVVHAVRALAASPDAVVEPPVFVRERAAAAASHPAVNAAQEDMVDRAVARFKASQIPVLTAAALERAVTKYEAHMRRLYGGT